MVAATRDADELKMFAWDNEDAWASSVCESRQAAAARGPGQGQGKARIAESPSRESLVLAESPPSANRPLLIPN